MQTELEATATAEAEAISSHLDGLYPHQIKGYESFKGWMDSSLQLAHLQGVGGSGKTFSIIRWCREYGLKPDEVMGIAPTNVAAHQLSQSTGLTCSTLHKGFGLVPKDAKWGKDEDEEYQKYQTQIEAIEAQLDDGHLTDDEGFSLLDLLKEDQLRIRALDSLKKAVSKNELAFTTSPDAGISHQIKLILADECSMIGEENFNIAVRSLPDNCKLLFMGDDQQLFPVNEGQSPAFSTPCIAQFNENVRAGDSDIAKLTAVLRQCKSYKDAHTLLMQTEPFDGDPYDVPDGSVCWVNRAESLSLVTRWAKELPADGSAYRVIPYKRKTVAGRNAVIKKLTETPLFGEGDTLLANSQIARTVMRNGSFFNNQPILFNGFTIELLGYQPIEHSATGAGGKRYDFELIRAEFANDNELGIEWQGSERCNHPGATWDDKQEWLHNPNLLRLLAPKDLPAYQELLKFWEESRSSFYGKSNKPEDGDRASAFLASINKKSWKQVQGTPGHIYKPDVDFSYEGTGFRWWAGQKDKKGRDVTEFEYLRSEVGRRFHWVKNLADDVQYPLASTVYKAQGSTIERVILDLNDFHSVQKVAKSDALRRALYTGCSRASKQLFLYF